MSELSTQLDKNDCTNSLFFFLSEIRILDSQRVSTGTIPLGEITKFFSKYKLSRPATIHLLVILRELGLISFNRRGVRLIDDIFYDEVKL